MLQCCLCLCFWFFGHKACGILAPWPDIEPAPPALKDITTGLPKSALSLSVSEGSSAPNLQECRVEEGMGSSQVWSKVSGPSVIKDALSSLVSPGSGSPPLSWAAAATFTLPCYVELEARWHGLGLSGTQGPLPGHSAYHGKSVPLWLFPKCHHVNSASAYYLLNHTEAF